MTQKQVISWLRALSARIEEESTTKRPGGYAPAIAHKVIRMCRDEALVITAPYIPMAHEDWKPDPDIVYWLEVIKQQTVGMFDERVT